MVLRAVRSQSEGAFVPHLALSVAIPLAFVCVATLVFFVGHMAGRINVDTVIDLVSEDVRQAITRLMHDRPQPPPPPPWTGLAAVDATLRALLLFIPGRVVAGESDATEAVRLRLGRWLAVALELGADILRTAVAPTWTEVGQLGAIVVLRAPLNFFLQLEIDKSEARRIGVRP